MSDIEVKPHISIKLSGGRALLLSFEEVVELKDKLSDVEQMARDTFNSNPFIQAYGAVPAPTYTASIDTNTIGNMYYDTNTNQLSVNANDCLVGPAATAGSKEGE